MFRKNLKKELDLIKNQNLYRKLKLEDNICLNFSTNDYLGLSKNNEVIKAYNDGLNYGAGATGSRLTSGNINHENLEETISEFKGTEKSLVYSSGYGTNLGVISALCKKGDLVLSDELNHASIVDGIRLSRADKKIYSHNNMHELIEILENSRNYENKFIVSDAVFSMDGDIAPVDELKKIADKYNAVLILDDAHGTGVLGKGRGTLHHFKIKPADNIIQIGTLSKAVGTVGGFVSGIEELIEYLINTSRSFIYSTALPPAVISASIKSFELIKSGELTDKLSKNINTANKIFKSSGFIEEEKITPIYPFIFGEDSIKISEELLKYKIFCVGIRYPTVKRGSERIRLSITAENKKEDFEYLCECISKIKNG
ncbi:aminotransferase class I/II-fold pyridoxal phosphate-dependent enzyme [Methanococcus maripaludis]|uniref:8-amino-7-oxononanoate synthase n=1 Tax=Methanococcus maripaludis (strain DSM 14266 / JCM 13030 / NBRC 101832 / S2 / LL) TaxID=267377 RepID=Q6LWY0_METMP|nr:8-amino-7-oxononanoate synthase [Methanococcus maripaludis]CAF31130.1 8-amino-7-oxononanoate synthase [Methanococcus maripaludis S2]